MSPELPSLITANATDGLKLAGDLTERLHAQLQSANNCVERPGGMNYLLPASVPKEITSAILFYAITAANRGWAVKS